MTTSPPMDNLGYEALYLIDGQPAAYWCIELLGKFSQVQSLIEFIVYDRINEYLPDTAKIIQKRYLGRLSDDERWEHVKALARQMNYSGDMQAASNAFWTCKRARDFFGHGPINSLVWNPRKKIFYYHVSGQQAAGLPSPLIPETVRILSVKCDWLIELISFLGYKNGMKCVSSVGHEHDNLDPHPHPIEMVDPGPVPNTGSWTPPAPIELPCNHKK